MDQTDAFFTQTVVGPPLTVMMGRRRHPGARSGEGLRIQFQSGKQRLTRSWKDWVVLSHACGPVGQPRMRPGPLRCQLERHALWLAIAGLVSLVLSLWLALPRLGAAF